jgi:hypothetical protein
MLPTDFLQAITRLVAAITVFLKTLLKFSVWERALVWALLVGISLMMIRISLAVLSA